MRLFDTHCHFETTDATAIAPLLMRAAEAGVEKLMAVGGSDALNASAVAARNTAKAMQAEGCKAPEVLIALGYDREQIGKNYTSPSPLAFASCAALGEIGLDYHYSPETRESQMALFATQLEEARRDDLPVVIHTREAANDTIGLLREIPSRGIIHCFTGEPDEARAYLDLGFYVSFSGIVTFKAADNVRASARIVPDDRLLLETDAPFLAPVPMRGKVNEPAFVRHTCEFLANFRGVSPNFLSELTFANAESVLKKSCQKKQK